MTQVPHLAPSRRAAARIHAAHHPMIRRGYRPDYRPSLARGQFSRLADSVVCLLASAVWWWRWGSGRRDTVSSRYRFILAEVARHNRRRPAWWDAPTVANPQIGRAGMLTLAQTWRANGGRWNGNRPHGIPW